MAMRFRFAAQRFGLQGSALVAVAVILISAASPAGSASASHLQRSSIYVRLVPAPPTLTAQCADAAKLVQFAVPCPSLVPSKNGVAMGCAAPVGPQPAPCVGFEGVTLSRIFDIEWENFDVPRGYIGIDGKATGHAFIEARKASDAPAKPCISGTRAGTMQVRSWRTAIYVCPNDSAYIERVARHGEGANVGHVVLEWRAGGVDYFASAHGHTNANLRLLGQLVASVTLVQPQR